MFSFTFFCTDEWPWSSYCCEMLSNFYILTNEMHCRSKIICSRMRHDGKVCSEKGVQEKAICGNVHYVFSKRRPKFRNILLNVVQPIVLNFFGHFGVIHIADFVSYFCGSAVILLPFALFDIHLFWKFAPERPHLVESIVVRSEIIRIAKPRDSRIIVLQRVKRIAEQF